MEAFIKEGGECTLSEVAAMGGIRAIQALQWIKRRYPSIPSKTMPGHTDKYPRLSFDGIRIANPEEMAKEASVIFMAATLVEYDTLLNVLTFQMEVPSNDSDIKKVVVGFRQKTVILVALSMYKRSMRSYGCTKALLTLAEGAKFFFKVGGAAGFYKVGTITVLSRGVNGVVLRDLYMEEDVQEAQNFPSPIALKFSYEYAQDGIQVVRTSATSGPKELHNALQFGSCMDSYESEFAGVRIATKSLFFQGELSMISVITENYGQKEFSGLSPKQAFDNLVKYLRAFIDTHLLIWNFWLQTTIFQCQKINSMCLKKR